MSVCTPTAVLCAAAQGPSRLKLFRQIRSMHAWLLLLLLVYAGTASRHLCCCGACRTRGGLTVGTTLMLLPVRSALTSQATGMCPQRCGKQCSRHEP